MPRLTKIRITGCKYDGFRKFYENTIFDLTRDGEPDHVLFTLKNQGGKGVLMQLLSQIAMPETKWGKQNGNKVTSLFYDQNSRFKPYTFHVVLEWKLDTNPEKWLITGICMTAYVKATNDDEIDEQMGLHYFMYTYEYDSYAYYTVEGLPMYNSITRKVADYEEYEKFIDDNKKYIIKYSQSASKRSDSDYYSYLRSKGIFRSEWEILKLINKVEGGVGEYFSKAADNKSIFDKSIIPAIVENMKNYSDDENGSLKEMFRSHLSITKNLPKLLEREVDYRNLVYNIDPVIQSMEIGLRRQNLWENCIRNGEDLYAAANNLLNSNKKNNLIWLDEKKKTIDQKEELKFQSENLEYVKIWRELKQKDEARTNLESDEENINLKIQELELERLVYETSQLLIERSELEASKAENEIIKQQLVGSLGMKEMEEELHALNKKLKEYWDATAIVWKEISKEHFCYEKSMQQKIERIVHDVNQAEDFEKTKMIRVELYEKEKNELEKERTKLAETFGMMEMHLPEMLLEELQKELDSQEAGKERLEESIENYRIKKSEHNSEHDKLDYSLCTARRKLNDLKKEYEDIKEKEEKLRISICSELSLDTEREVFRGSWLEKQKGQLEILLNEKNAKLDYLKQELWKNNIDKQINRENYWIPNQDILTVRDNISELGIAVQLGTEYLYNLEDEAERKKLLEQHPLLTYGVLIANEVDMQLIRDSLGDGLFTRNAVPIYIRSIMAGSNKADFDSVSGFGFKLATNSSEFLKWYNKLQDVDDGINASINTINSKINKIQTLLKDIAIMENGHSSELILEIISQVDTDIEEITTNINALLDNITKLSELESQDKAKLEELNKQYEETTKQAQNIEQFIAKLKKLEVDAVGIGKERKELEELKESILKLKEEKFNLERAIQSDSNLYVGWKIEAKEAVKRIKCAVQGAYFEENKSIDSNFLTYQTPNYKLLDEEFNICLSQYSVMNMELEQKNSEILLVNQKIQHLETDIKKLETRLDKLNADWKQYNSLEKSKLEHEVRLEEIYKEFLDIKEKASKIHDSLTRIKTEIDGLEKSRRKSEENIRERYFRAPLLLEDIDLVQREFQIKTSIKDNNDYLGKVEGILEEIEQEKRKLEATIGDLKRYEELDFKRGKINSSILEKMKENPLNEIEEWINKYKRISIELKDDQEKAESDIENYRNYVKNNVADDILKGKMLQSLQSIRTERFKSNLESFTSMKEHFLKEISTISNDKARAEEVRLQWTQRAARHAITMIEALKSMIFGMNYINESGHVFPLVKLKGDEQLPKDEKDIIYGLKEYFVESINALLKDNEDIENIDDQKLEKLMGDQAIFSKALSGRYPKLMVYKMTEKNEFRKNKPRDSYYTTWEAINKGEGDLTEGSGGQTLSVNTFVIMMLMNYQKKHIGNENPWTVLLLDNPFGKASGSHVLDPIFEIADKLNFQLIAFAAPEIIKVEISERFPVFWALKISDKEDKLPGSVFGRVIYGGRVIK